jgi:hypothetical protein
LKRILLGVVAVLGTLYVCDFVSARMQPLGTVEIRRYYAVGLKNNRTEYMFDSSANQECVRSFLPQMGRKPCWYLERHKVRMIDVAPPKLPQF